MTELTDDVPILVLDSMIERLRAPSDQPYVSRSTAAPTTPPVASVLGSLLDRPITGNSLVVYLALRYLRPEGGFQGREALAERTGLDAEATIEAIIELTREGLLDMHDEGWAITPDPATKKEES